MNLKFLYATEELKGNETYGEWLVCVNLMPAPIYSLHGNGWIILIYYWVSLNFVIVCGCR